MCHHNDLLDPCSVHLTSSLFWACSASCLVKNYFIVKSMLYNMNEIYDLLMLYIYIYSKQVFFVSFTYRDHQLCGSMRGYTFTPSPVWDLLVPLAKTPGRRDQQILVSHMEDTGKVESKKWPKLQKSSRCT